MSNEQKITRKLTAILSADVKGYSLLMANDEAHTIKTLKAYRSLMSKLIELHSGRVVDNPGDNLLAEFSSAVDAVEAAVQIQNNLKKENAKFVEDKRLQFRIGVNIGDVVHDGDRIYGSGVNVAARIEGIADPGGICISRGTYDQVKDKLDLGFDYLGEHQVKNINDPVRVYKVLMDTDAPMPLVEEELELPDKPSIAVLPFSNMSGDPGQEYFSDGLTEQIINGLCKVSNLFVIARKSSFAYKGKAVSVKQIAKELGVRYILEGSVQRSGNRVRITAQLINAKTDYHMWSDNYDRNLDDIFALQDEITMKLITALGVKLIHGEQFKLYVKDIKNIQAFEKFMRGLEFLGRQSKLDNTNARISFLHASELDASSAQIYAGIGFTYLLEIFYNWSHSIIESFKEAEYNAKKAIALNETLDSPHILMSYILLFKKLFDGAVSEAQKAVSLNPNGADAQAALGYITCMAGDPDNALVLLKQAIRLNPLPPALYYQYLGIAYRNTGKFKQAISVLTQSLEIDHESRNALTPHLTLASSYVSLNRLEDAKKSVDKILEIDPNFRLEYYKDMVPLRKQSELDAHIKALRKAGLPD